MHATRYTRRDLLRAAVLTTAVGGFMRPAETRPMHMSSRPKMSPAAGSEWEVCAPEDQCVDSYLLKEAAEHLARTFPRAQSLLVVRNGFLVFERYFRDANLETLNRAASITKSVISTLVGAAIREGRIRSIEQRVTEFFPELRDAYRGTPKEQMRLRHLLSMTDGLRYFEFDDAFDHLWSTSPDPALYVLQLPSAHQPGNHFNYSTGAYQVLSRILTRTTGRKAAAYADEHLFGPLGISHYRWNVDNSGDTLGGGGLDLRSRDLAKLGRFCLQHGKWEGRKIVAPGYLKEAMRKQTDGGEPGRKGWGYGLGWWTATLAGHPASVGLGFGGQHLVLLPELQAVIVATAARTGEDAEDSFWSTLERYVAPALAPLATSH